MNHFILILTINKNHVLNNLFIYLNVIKKLFLNKIQTNLIHLQLTKKKNLYI
jgi:hypothetical protein